MDTERIILSMTREQAYTVMRATELLARLHIGQFKTITEMLIDWKDGERITDTAYRRDRADEALMLAEKLIYPGNTLSKDIEHERAWAVYATIRHAIAWHDNPQGNYLSVAFDEPMSYSPDEPLPRCTVEQEQG